MLVIHHSPPLSDAGDAADEEQPEPVCGNHCSRHSAVRPVRRRFENGRMVAASTLAPWGVDPGGIVQVDGSGLSRYNYVTAEALMTILLHVDRDKVLRGPFEASLAVAGVDGTLAARMKGQRQKATPARSRARWPTSARSPATSRPPTASRWCSRSSPTTSARCPRSHCPPSTRSSSRSRSSGGSGLDLIAG